MESIRTLQLFVVGSIEVNATVRDADFSGTYRSVLSGRTVTITPYENIRYVWLATYDDGVQEVVKGSELSLRIESRLYERI
jgi:hypothetical protein